MQDANINAALRLDTSNIKAEYIRALNAAMINAAEEYKTKGLAAEKIHAFEAQAATLIAKAESLPVVFFTGIKLGGGHSDGQIIARAVAAA